MRALQYLKSRLGEKSTWASIGVGIPVAAALPVRWAQIAMLIATVIGVLVPEPAKAA